MKILRTIVSILLVGCLVGCQQFQINEFLNSDRSKESLVLTAADSNLSEVAIPQTIRELKQSLEQYNPQVKIISPRTGKTLDRTDIEVELTVTDLPLFQDDLLKLGNHLSLIIDNEAPISVYDLTEPFLLKNLMPGTHTLRIFATTPWGESFKNQGAYAQTTFNVLTETNSNHPDPQLPLLTYNSPSDTYGAEPILLDFHLNYPSFVSNRSDRSLKEPLIRATVNGTSFMLEKWQPYYLAGFEPGENWVQLELIDEFGNNIENTFNNTVRVFDYDPKQQDTLSKLVTNQISSGEARSIVEQNYYIQPVETSEPTDLENQAELDITSERLDNEPEITGDRLPEETIPNVLEDLSKEMEAAETEKTLDSFSIEEIETNTSEPLPTAIPKIVSETKSDLEVQEDEDLRPTEKSLPSKSINEPELSNQSSKIDSVILPLQQESTPNKISIKESEATQQPLVEIILPEPESVEISQLEATNLESTRADNQQSKTSAFPTGQSGTEIIDNRAIEKDAISSSPVLKDSSTRVSSENALSASEEADKLRWWKKILVRVRQTIESLARQLPNEV